MQKWTTQTHSINRAWITWRRNSHHLWRIELCACVRAACVCIDFLNRTFANLISIYIFGPHDRCCRRHYLYISISLTERERVCMCVVSVSFSYFNRFQLFRLESNWLCSAFHWASFTKAPYVAEMKDTCIMWLMNIYQHKLNMQYICQNIRAKNEINKAITKMLMSFTD